MKEFALLISKLDSTNSVKLKVQYLLNYFMACSKEDLMWCIALFTGKKPKRILKVTQLKEMAMKIADVPEWLFLESYEFTGDLAETIHLLLPQNAYSQSAVSLHVLLESMYEKSKATDEEKLQFVSHYWNELSSTERFVFNKLITGGFRIGVSENLLYNALSKYLKKESLFVQSKLAGKWNPLEIKFDELFAEDSDDLSKPFPFMLAHAIQHEKSNLKIEEYVFEKKFDGIRVQFIKRQNMFFLWSRGEELINRQFPEFEELTRFAPHDFVFDGELVSFNGEHFLDFSYLQKRLGRKKPSEKFIAQNQCKIIAYDVLEFDGKDLRMLSLTERKKILKSLIEKLTEQQFFKISESEIYQFSNWQEPEEKLNEIASHICEGWMVKNKTGVYSAGRVTGNWYKWKVKPFSIDAVLIYAQTGHGRRAGMYTDFTFAVWKEKELVPFAKAYSGLTNAELAEIDKWIKANTIDKFGPVRSVTPFQVFEIAFESIQFSGRHKSGIAVRFPRILRWRKDKTPESANTINELLNLIEQLNEKKENHLHR